MMNVFPGYYALSPQELKELWQNALFALDANVLLNLYRYPKQARIDLLSIFSRVSDRLWVPHQAALEYQRNRPKVVAEQRHRYYEVKQLLDDGLSQLRTQFDKLQLKKRHSSIDPTEFLEQLEKVAASFRKALDDWESKQPDVFESDELRQKLEGMFAVGPAAESQKALDEIYAEAKRRFEKQIPPGYRDISKSDASAPQFAYGGLLYDRTYGDMVLWKQVLHKAKSDGVKHVILVTDDEKDDWWWIEKSSGPKKLGPRPELVEEMRRVAGVTHFGLYTSESFMKLAEEHLKVAVKAESIDQIGDISRAVRSVDPVHSRASASELEGAVQRWLEETYGPRAIERVRDFPDFIVTSPGGRKIGFEVQSYTRGMRRLREAIELGYLFTEDRNRFDEFTLVVVVFDEPIAIVLREVRALLRRIPPEPSRLNAVVGTILPMADDDEVHEFEVLHTIHHELQFRSRES